MASGTKKASDGLFRRGGEGPWYCWVRGKRYSTRTSDRKAARLVKAKLERAAADPVYLAAHQTTFGDAVKGFLENFATRGKSPHTLKMYRVKCGHLIRFFGAERLLAEVEARLVDKFTETRIEEGAERTELGKEMTALRQVLRLARRQGTYPYELSQVMPHGFSLKYIPRKRALTFPEIELLIPEIARFSLKHAALVAFAIAVAPRKSEVEAAHGEDIDWDNWIVRVRGTKTDLSDDDVPIAAPFREMFAKWVPRRPGLLFGEWSNMTRDLAAACKRAGIDRVTANDLRRTTATRLRAAGVSADIVARVLRHVDSRMVERVYGRIKAADTGRVLADQIQLSEQRRAETKSGNSEKHQCPRTELNRRHEDFQSETAGWQEAKEAKNSGVPARGGSAASPVSAGAPTRFSSLSLEDSRARLHFQWAAREQFRRAS